MKHKNIAKLKFIMYCTLFLTFTQISFAQTLSTPYLQTPTESSIWICWKTDVGTESTVNYGLSQSDLNTSANGTCQTLSANFLYHSTQLTGLQPNSTYYYKVTTGKSTSQVYSFKTQPAPSSKTGHYRILVWGDHQLINSSYENKSREDTLLTRAKKNIEKLYGTPIEQSINLVLCDGDQVDAGTLNMYENEHFRIGSTVSANVPIMTCVGNHETYSDPDMTNYKSLFFYDKLKYGGIASPGGNLYYAYQLANIVYIVVNTEDNSDEQLNWIKSIVAAANADANVGWIVSVAHRPYNCEQYVGDYSQWFRNSVMPVLATSSKSALFISGHHHLYHRGQTKEWPIYHICSGGASWDQYWGQSTEQDMDDIQKTIANWAYQIIDFDLAKKTMEVKSYSIGHPLLGIVYNDKVIDQFHRTLDLQAPTAPVVTNTIPSTITLPYTFTSSDYKTSTTEILNSTQFQISTSSTFNTLEKDILRDIEDFYGDSGAPLYTPINLNDTVNILKLTIGKNELLNGTHYIRLRHRDANAMWSDWSNTVEFNVSGSIKGDPTITIAKKIFTPNENISVEYKYGTGNAKDWLGIYEKGQTPGSINSTQWTYVTDINGSYSFNGLSPYKEYFIGYFSNDGYTEIAPRQYFYVGSVPTLSSDKTQYSTTDAITLKYASAPGQSTDWIGIYKCGEEATTNGTKATAWKYVTATDGTINFDNLAKGYYYASYFVNDGFTEISSRYTFQVGDTIATVSLSKNAYQPSEDVVVTFTDGPGGPKDYIGIFKEGDVAGTNPLVTYKYVNGLASGSITIPDDIPSGRYYLALFPNDSYTLISRPVYFTVSGSTETSISESEQNQYSIYPNPCNSKFIIQANNTLNKTANILITNELGSVYYKANNITITNTMDIDVSNLHNGIYTVTIITSTDKINKKLLILH